MSLARALVALTVAIPIAAIAAIGITERTGEAPDGVDTSLERPELPQPYDPDPERQAADYEAMRTALAALTALETYAADNRGIYEGASVRRLAEIDPALAEAELDVGTPGPNGFLIKVSSESGAEFMISGDGDAYDNDPEPTLYFCSSPPLGGGACPEEGGWESLIEG